MTFSLLCSKVRKLCVTKYRTFRKKGGKPSLPQGPSLCAVDTGCYTVKVPAVSRPQSHMALEEGTRVCPSTAHFLPTRA